MKKFLSTLWLLSTILFFDYIVLIVIGWLAIELGASDSFYCGVYCKIGVSLLVISFIGVLWYYQNAISKKNLV